jgi:hypothetical protein
MACLVEGEEVVLTADGHVGYQVRPALSVLLHGLAKALLAALRPGSLKMSSATFQVELHRNKKRFIFPLQTCCFHKPSDYCLWGI